MKKRNHWKDVIKAMIPFIFVTVLFSPFFQSCQKEEVIEPEKVTLKNGGIVQFFTTPDLFPCSGLPMEDFEEAFQGNDNPCLSGINPTMENPLDENTSNVIFSTGNILSGISIKTSGTSTLIIADPCYDPHPPSRAVFVNSQDENLIIEFTDNNVTNVSMEVLSFADLSQAPITITIEIFGSEGTLGTTIVFADVTGTYFGVQSMVPITKIELTAAIEAPGVDDISFGTCVVLDSDGDGVTDDVDNCINVANPNQEDLDADGIGDVCDDSDGDGVTDDSDNCPNAANSDQKDWDGDGIGDVCDDDSDGDGCPNSDDVIDVSNMEKFVNIDGCSNGVPNKMTLGVPCGTMMSDVIDGLELAKYKNHGAFVKAILKVATEWYTKGLITLEEKAALLTCAEASSIGNKK